MQMKQKQRHAAAWIGVCLLCITTILVFSAAAAAPVRSLIHLRIQTNSMDSFTARVSYAPIEINMDDVDPDDPDYPMIYEERYQEANRFFENAVMIASNASGDVYEFQSDFWRVVSYPDEYEDNMAHLSFLQSSDDMSNVFDLAYVNDPGASTIYSDHTGKYYTQLDIYIDPQYDYTGIPTFALMSQKDLRMIAYLANCGFQMELSPYPDITAIRNDAYSEGRLAGYDEGFNAGIQQGGGDSDGSYADGYKDGFDAGKTDTLNGTGTLKEMIVAIVTAPGYLIDSVLDFNLLGINLASFVKTLITLSLVGLIVFFIVKVIRG